MAVKNPLIDISRFWSKTPIMGLLMIMTLALLVYAIAQRRLHKILESLQKTVPNQIRKETSKPTLRWIFQLLDGIELVKMHVEKTTHTVVSGLTVLKRRILSYFGDTVMKIYRLVPEPALICPRYILE